MNGINKCCGAIAEFLIDLSGNKDLSKENGIFGWNPDRKLAKAQLSYNIKAHIYNCCTVTAICSVVFAIFGAISATSVLVWLCASLAGRVFIQQALDESAADTVLGLAEKLQDPKQKKPLEYLFKRYLIASTL